MFVRVTLNIRREGSARRNLTPNAFFNQDFLLCNGVLFTYIKHNKWLKNLSLTSTLLLLSCTFDLLIKTTKYLFKHLLVSMITVRQLSGIRFTGLVVIVLIKKIWAFHFADDYLRAIPEFEKYMLIYLFLRTSHQFNASTVNSPRTISLLGYCLSNIKERSLRFGSTISPHLLGKFMLFYLYMKAFRKNTWCTNH